MFGYLIKDAHVILKSFHSFKINVHVILKVFDIYFYKKKYQIKIKKPEINQQ